MELKLIFINNFNKIIEIYRIYKGVFININEA